MSLTEVTPVKRDPRSDRKDYKYRFKKIHVQDVTGEEFDDRVTIIHEGDSFRYWFKESPVLVVYEDKVYTHKRLNVNEAELRAYFMVDILDDYGKVTGWRRVGES